MAQKNKPSKRNSGKAKRNKPAPLRRMCGCMQAQQGPNFRARQQALEHATARRMVSAALARAGAPITIPVVVHVLFKTASENISVAQIKNLALARKNPVGNPTTGITRTQTTRASFGTNDSVKSTAAGGIDPWPTNKYLNIWVCTLGCGLLGYAQFPGGPPQTDGVVILNTAFGTKGTATPPFNLGRTTTHEVGHWLNLRHIWGDTEDCSGGDFVADTPNAEGPNFGKPVFPRVSCVNGPNGDMFMNYMYYVDDEAMFMFTAQQVVRMSAALEGPRNSIGRP